MYSYKGKGSFTNAKPRDILIVRSNGKDFTHIELVSKLPSSKSITAIGGNTGNKNHSKATEIYKNTAGNYWYKVTADRDGITGYVYAGAASYTGISKEAVRGNLTLATTAPKKGKAVTISGTISGNGAKIVSVKGILKGTGSTQTASASVNGSSFSLKGSKVDGGLKFGKLGVGSGSIRLEVMVQVSYIGTNNKIVPANGTIILPEVKFTVKK